MVLTITLNRILPTYARGSRYCIFSLHELQLMLNLMMISNEIIAKNKCNYILLAHAGFIQIPRYVSDLSYLDEHARLKNKSIADMINSGEIISIHISGTYFNIYSS